MRILTMMVFLLILNPVKGQDTLKLSLLFTGDIMQHDSQIHAAFNPDSSVYSYKPCFDPIRTELASADLTIGNLELTFGGPPYKGYPQFSAPDELMTTLKDAGFDVLVTANNHCLDRGALGLERTLEMINQASILHTGTFKDTLEWLNEYPLVISRSGFRLSLLNYTYGTNGMPLTFPNMVNMIDTIRLEQDLIKAKLQDTDAIIVFFHWGKEYERQPNVRQRDLTEFCFKHGAKLVIGSHPHVLQPMEWRKESDQFIAYSLGNFVSGQYDRYKNGGAMLHIDLKKVLKLILKPKYMVGYV